jgi:hypothetical protein
MRRDSGAKAVQGQFNSRASCALRMSAVGLKALARTGSARPLAMAAGGGRMNYGRLPEFGWFLTPEIWSD